MTLAKSGAKHLIILDQYCTSNMYCEEPLPLWSEIRKLLHTRHEEGKLFCPVPNEHFLETSQRTYALGIAAIQGQMEISDGYLFQLEPFITANLIISGLRQQEINMYTFLSKEKVIFEKEENFEKVKNVKEQFDSMSSKNLNGLNDVRIHTRDSKMERQHKDLFLKAIISTELSSFTQRIRQVLNDKSLTIRPARFGDIEIPNGVDQLLYVLMNSHKMTLPETIHLLVHMESKGFDGIPTLDVKSQLLALNAIQHKKEQESDHIDFMRISTGLPVSDVLFTDKRRKNEIIELGLDKKYSCRVYSGNNEDLLDFRKFLNEL